MRIPRHRWAILAVLAVFLWPANAHAIGIQNDEALKYDAATFFQRADQLNADWVRIMVPYNRWHNGEADAYVAAAKAAHDSGLHVMASLMSWYDYPSPDEWATYAREVEPLLAPYVDAWSVMNEPNWPGMAPAMNVSCRDQSGQTVTVRNGYRIAYRFRHARRGHWSRRHHHWVHRRIKHHPRYRRIHTRTIVTRSASTSTTYRTCLSEGIGHAYRRVYDAAAPELAKDTGALIVAGDLCPSNATLDIMQSFLAPGRPAVDPDVFASHYSTPWQAAVYTDYAHNHGMRYWESEWGLPGEHPTGRQWLDAYHAITAATDNVFVYDTGLDGGWDTRIPDDALAALGN